MDDLELTKFLGNLNNKVKEMHEAGASQKEISRFASTSWRKEQKRLGISHPLRFLKGLYIFLFISSIITLILVGVANWAFPEGIIYGAGTPDWWQGPSPLSNPSWVRFFQNYGGILIFGGLLVSSLSAYMIWERSES